MTKLLALGLLVGLGCWAGIELTRLGERVASIWLANGLLAGLLLGWPARRWPAALLAGLAGNVTANALAGDPPALALGLALCNSLEVLLAAALLRRRCGLDFDLRQGRALLHFVWVAVLLAPAAGALLAALLLSAQAGLPLLQTLALWYPADVLGMAIVAPLVLALQRPAPATDWRSWLLAMGLLLVVALLVFTVASRPFHFLFLTIPPLLLLSFRHGDRGAALGVMALAAIAIPATLLRGRLGDGLDGVPLAEGIFVLQCYLAFAAALSLSAAALLEQRCRYEREQRQAAHLLRSVTDHLPALIAYVDADRRCRFVNAGAARLFGMEPSAMLGLQLQELGGLAQDPTLQPHLDAVLAGEPRSFEGVAQIDGETRHYQASLLPDAGTGGGVQGFHVLALDITARKEAELRQGASEERLRTIADNLPVAIAYLDERRVYRFCNRRHESWFGVPAEAVLGRRLDEVLPPEVREAQRYFLECALHGARAEGYFAMDNAGSQRQVQICCLPHLGAQDEVRGVYVMMTDVTDSKRVERQLQQLARFDPLTGLANRRELGERLSAGLGRVQRHGGALALLFIDVDRFKAINDQHGHSSGDEVLQELALRLRSEVRATDTVARIAGDEFVVILERISSDEEPQRVATKLLAAVNRPFLSDQGPLQVGISIGIALAREGDLPEQLLRRADRALYAAKDGGRNTSRMAV